MKSHQGQEGVDEEPPKAGGMNEEPPRAGGQTAAKRAAQKVMGSKTEDVW